MPKPVSSILSTVYQRQYGYLQQRGVHPTPYFYQHQAIANLYTSRELKPVRTLSKTTIRDIQINGARTHFIVGDDEGRVR